MPKDKDFKRVVRERMARTGERYTDASAALDRRTPRSSAGEAPRSDGGALPAVDEGWRAQLGASSVVLREVNAATAGAWRLEARFAGGLLHGAWRIRQGSAVAVLKWHDPTSPNPYNTDAPAVVEYLRAHGYPTPAWIASGVTPSGVAWAVQELVDGEPLRELDLTAAEVLIELVSLHRRLSPPTELSWNQQMRANVFTAHALHASIADAGGEAAAVLAQAMELAAPYESASLTDTELVHWDLNVSNLLVNDGRLVGVVDIDGAGRGSAVYDLLSPVVNAVSWQSDDRAIEILTRFALETYTPAEVAVAAASLAIELTSWYSRRADIAARAVRHRRWLTALRTRLP